MVGNLTVGKPKYADAEGVIKESLGKLDSLRERLLELVDEDARAFAPLAAVYAMPRESEEEKRLRSAAMQEALVGACEVPLSIMEACVSVLAECEVMANNGSKLAISDAGASAVLAKAATYSASLNVFINTSSMEDATAKDHYDSRADKLLEKAAELGDGIFDKVMSEIRR